MPIPLDILADLGTKNEDRSDYRAVPASDDGETYRDRGGLGGYQTDAEPFPMPREVKFATGFGADDADLRRGWSDPLITQNPAYQFANYELRSSEPKVSNVQQGDAELMEDDWSFRNRNRRSQGFLTRPRIPTER